MKYTGRLISILFITSIHTLYVVYAISKFLTIDLIYFFGYPFFMFIAYSLGLQFDKMKFYAEKDTLTNLYNRRFLLNHFEKHRSGAKRSQHQYYVLVIDCDNFKLINDTYGHPVGDDVLCGIGHILKKRTRSTDIVVRWGGDEFVLFGQYEGEEALKGLINRIKEELLLFSSDLNIPISISIGSSIYPDDHYLLDELVSVADRNMYLDKKIHKA